MMVQHDIFEIIVVKLLKLFRQMSEWLEEEDVSPFQPNKKNNGDAKEGADA